MIVFGLLAWFVLFTIFETNILGKIILIPISIAAFVFCIPLMLVELVMLDIWAILIALCLRSITVWDVLEFLLAPLCMY